MTARGSGAATALERLWQERTARLGEAIWPILGVVVSMLAVAPLAAIAGASVPEAYAKLFDASFGSPFGFGVLVTFSIPLILVGLAVAVPYRAGLFNIGGEGQLVAGALAAVVVAQFAAAADVPGSFLLALLGAAFAGAVPGAIAGALKAWHGINEIVTTIMLNFIAILFVQYWITGPFKDEELTFAASPTIQPGFAVGKIGERANVPITIFVALAVVVAVGWVMEYTRRGWRFRLLGLNRRLAERQGISSGGGYLAALTIGGALAGLGGGADVVGNQLRVGQDFSPGWGFDAIAIALLARGNAFAVVPLAFFFAFLRNGSGVLQSQLGIPGFLVVMLAGAPVIVVAAVLGYRSYQRVRATEA